MSQIKIYLAHSLTQASDEFKNDMQKLKGILKSQYEIIEFLGLNAGNAEDVYEYDTGCIKKCDWLVAEISHASLGVGFEIATALNNNKKVFAFAKPDIKISRMILGITDKNFVFSTYSNIQEIIDLLNKQNV
jgi:nucleoside 2-deoxyribosyltransferase